MQNIVGYRETKGRVTYLDRELFSEIYDATYARVYNYICYRIGNHSDIEDLVSTVYARAIARYATYDSKRGTFDVWLFGIARNALTDYFRKRSKRNDVNIEPLAETLTQDGAMPDEIAIQNEEKFALLKALSTLSERERHIIALKYAAVMNNKDISRLTSLSESNVGVILFRSLRKLKQELCKEVEPCVNHMMTAGKSD